MIPFSKTLLAALGSCMWANCQLLLNNCCWRLCCYHFVHDMIKDAWAALLLHVGSTDSKAAHQSIRIKIKCIQNPLQFQFIALFCGCCCKAEIFCIDRKHVMSSMSDLFLHLLRNGWHQLKQCKACSAVNGTQLEGSCSSHHTVKSCMTGVHCNKIDFGALSHPALSPCTSDNHFA